MPARKSSKSQSAFPALPFEGNALAGGGQIERTRRNTSMLPSASREGREDTFHNVQHPDLRADYVLANPPFNDSDRFRKDDDVRYQFGVPFG